MKEKIDISIIIPVYNTPKDKVKRCLDSVKKINQVKYEIILIDDGSEKENSIEYKKLINEKITYKKTTNQGVSEARNKGIKLSKGNYLLFVDSDDELIPEKIEKDILKKDYDVICYNILEIMKNNKNYIKKELNSKYDCIYDKKDIVKEMITNSNFFFPSSKLYKRKMIKDNNILFNKEIIHGEDAVFNLNVLTNSNKIYYKNDVLYKYYFEVSNYEKRWVKDYKSIMNNYYYKNNLFIETMNTIEMDLDSKKTLETELKNNTVNQVFRMALINSNTTKISEKEFCKYIRKYNISYKDLVFIKKIKYYLLLHLNNLGFKTIYNIRKLYLRIKRS